MTFQKLIDDDSQTLMTEASSPASSPRVFPVTLKRRLRVKISLAFNESFPIASRASMGIEDLRATWYDKTEYNAMKSNIIPILRKMMKNEIVEESDKETTRGLEYRTRKGANLRQENKLNGIKAVLDEQRRQRLAGIKKPELISQAYLDAAAAQCQEAAQNLAIADALEAREYCQKIKSSLLSKARAEVKKFTHFRVRSPFLAAPGKSAAVAA
ncbi:hypothetical protein FisN_8Lh051 [Fistulifera solaris]|uniref:Uncharacterized protein n=1 Tax=Fistulifera solaris TaxID=1519565 RepID=A0A1Z5JDB2_FISSO|nr:hypothetical protein FisN_8Lh051 [Fistulifera solaris]|eukprot:GAX11959.1 hypothetical protein FisN_8Lh051 [Fistulifera solaris]